MFSSDFRKYKILMRPLLREMVYSGTASTGFKESSRRRSLWRGKRSRSQKKESRVSMTLIVIFLSLMMSFYSVMLSIGLTGPLLALDQENLYLSLISTIIPILILLFGVLQSITTLYHDTSLEALLVLPVKPSVVIAAKMTQAFLPVALSIFLFTFPGLVAHGVISGRPWLFYPQALFYVPLSLIAPYAVVISLLLIVMRYTKFARNKDRFQMVTSIIFIVLSLAFVFLIQTMPDSDTGYILLLQQKGVIVLVNSANRFIPSAWLGTTMLANASNWSTLLCGVLLLAFDVLLLVILFALANRLYLPGALGVKGNASSRQRSSKRPLSRSLRKRSPYRAIVSQEWRLLIRTPAFFTQTILPVLLLPPFFAIMFFVVFTRELPIDINLTHLSEIFFQTELWKESLWIVALVLAGISSFLSGTNTISATAISRQGKDFFYTKTMPVHAKTQLLAWLTPGFIVMILIWALIITVIGIVFQPPFLFILFVIFFALINGTLPQLVTLFVDLKQPMLDWENELQAVKNTKSVMVSAIGLFVYALLLAALAFITRSLTSGNNTIVTLVIVLVPLAFTVGFAVALIRNAERYLQRLDA